MENKIISQQIEQILGLDSPLIAVKIVKTDESSPNIISTAEISVLSASYHG